MTSGAYLWGNLALAFVLELCGLAAFGYWGAHTGTHILTRVALGIGAPLVAALLWGVFAAPRAPAASPAAAAVVQVVFFLAAALALGITGHPRLAATVLILVLVNSALLHLLHQPTSAQDAAPAGKDQPASTFYAAHTRQPPEHTANTAPAAHPGGSSPT